MAYRVGALRFFYVRTLKRPAMKEDLPYPHSSKHARRLPTILTPEEVSKLIDSARNLFHYAMLLTMYSAGLRRSELCKLKVSNTTLEMLTPNLLAHAASVHPSSERWPVVPSRDFDSAPAPSRAAWSKARRLRSEACAAV